MGLTMNEWAKPSFWTMRRRAWLYGVITALVPLLVAIGMIAGDIAEKILQVAAAILAVGGSSMALSNLTPDNVFKVGLKIEDKTDE